MAINKLKKLAQKNLNPKIEEVLKIEVKSINNQELKTINGRNLHQWLDVKSEFRHWIKRRIKKYQFTENRDYLTINKKINRQIFKEYYLTIDMAKQLAMVENNKKGLEARQHFIKCEEVLKQVIQNHQQLLEDPIYLRKTLGNYVDKVLELQPKAEVYDKLIDSKENICLSDAIKQLGFEKLKDGFAWLNKILWIFKREKSDIWKPYQDKIEKGYLVLKVNKKILNDNYENFPQTLATPKGLAKLVELRNKEIKVF